MRSSADAHVETTVEGALGHLRLTRERAINSLDTPMVAAITRALELWEHDPTVRAVAIDGAGERGLCAGGDIRMMRTGIVEGRPEEAMSFWRQEYAMDARIASYPKPYVAFMDGITMGGGLGVSTHGSVRLATATTKVAMPETVIGFFPDVGALSLLARMPGEIGTYLALTGTSIDGWDAVDLGLADAVIDAGCWPEVLQRLRGWDSDQGPTLTDLVDEPLPRPADRTPLLERRGWVDPAFAGDSAPEILARLEGSGDPQQSEAADLVRARSPWSVCTTLAAVRRAAHLSVEETLAQDLHLCEHVLTEPDFVEGVRAQVVDKDRSPRWRHARVEDVDPAEIEALFG